MIAETKRLSQVPEEHLLKDMRKVETKMGFVLTLVRRFLSGSDSAADRRSYSSKPLSGVLSTSEPLLQIQAKMKISISPLTRQLCNNHWG